MEETRFRRLVEESGCDALLTFGAENFRYMTGATLPFPDNYPERRAVSITPADEGDTCAVVAPPDWVQSIRDQGWLEPIEAYDENEGPFPSEVVKTLVRTLNGMGLAGAKLGFDASRTPAGLLDALRSALPEAKFLPVDDWLTSTRAVKRTEEVALIEKSCEYADRGIIHGLNHLEGTLWGPGYTLPEFAERVRVHVFEDGASGVGHLAVTMGDDTQLEYTPMRGNVKEGQLLRCDVTSHSMGYWSATSRMAFTGEAPPELDDSYYENQALKAYAVELLEPGARCDRVYSQVHGEAEKMGVRLHGTIIGHGVGCSHFEAPYLTDGYPFELKVGNVIAIGVATLGPRRQIIVDRDVYEITPQKPRKLSWYRSWERLYEVTGFRAVH